MKAFVKIIVFGSLYLLTGLLIASLYIWAPNIHNDFPLFRDFIILFATILLSKYFLYMLVSPWYDVLQLYKEKQWNKTHTEPYAPLVSVIIPAWNEEVGIVRTVQSVLQSNYTNLEVIVVNDGSTDKSDTLMRDFVAEYEAETGSSNRAALKYFYKENGGKGTALNYGIAHSHGEIIISIDADCALRADTIPNFVKQFRDPKVMATVGNVRIGNTEHVLGTLQHLEFLFSFYFKKADSLFNTIYIIGGAAGAFRREVFEKIGIYSTKNITEDIDLSVRIQEAGMRITYAADAIVYTEGASTLQGLMQQRLRWKRGRFQTFAEHRELFFSTKPEHSFLLSWFVLPLAAFGDMQLFFEIVFLAFLYIYSFFTHDFSSFISGIVVVSSMFFVQLFDQGSDPNSKRSVSLYLLAPVGWLLFYITTVVEYRALLTSIWGMFTNKKLTWQRWDRTGVFDESAEAAPVQTT